MNMNTPNALGFIGAGLLAEALLLLPGNSAASEVWLLAMGALLMAVGAVFLVNVAWQWTVGRLVLPLLAFWPRHVEERGRAVPQGRRAPV